MFTSCRSSYSSSSTLSTRRRFLEGDPARTRLRPSRLLPHPIRRRPTRRRLRSTRLLHIALVSTRRSPRARLRRGFRARNPARRRGRPGRHRARSARDRARSGVRERGAAAGAFLAGVGELLGEGGLFAHEGAFPVDDVDRDDEEAGDAD